jgi:copper(I)-binding protein
VDDVGTPADALDGIEPMKLHAALLFAAGVFLAGAAAAHDYRVGSLVIGHPWSRATPKAAPAGIGFLTIVNTGSTADRLVSVSSPAAAQVELHEMSMADGVMRMRPLDRGIEIPAGGRVDLAPGGRHVMFIGLAAPFVRDTRFRGTLTFEKAGAVDVEFAVEGMGADGPAHGLPEHGGGHSMPMK